VQFAPWLVFVGIPVVILSFLGVWPAKRQKQLSAALFLGAFGIAPLFIVGLTSLFASFGYNVRHALWCYLPLQIIVARGIAMGRPRWLTVTCAVLLGASSLVAIWNHHYQDRYRHEDLRAAAQFLSGQTEADSPIFVLSGYMAKPLNDYLPEDRLAHPLGKTKGEPETGDATTGGGEGDSNRGEVEQARTLLAEIGRHDQAGSPILLVYTREFHGDPQGQIFQAIREVYDLRLVASFAGVRIYRESRITPDTL